MGLRDISQFVLLGEDAFHRTFMRQWLMANDVSHRQIHVVEPPADKSGGWKFVVGRCGDEVIAARARNKRVQTRLIVMIDADDESLEQRRQRIATAMEESMEGDLGDLVCVLIPKRHIETWIVALGPEDPPVDESADYKPRSSDEVKAAARRLARMIATPPGPPSLVRAYAELANLKK